MAGALKKRRGVAIRSHPKGDQIEGWEFSVLKLEASAHLGFVAGGGNFGVELALNAMNLAGLERHMVEQAWRVMR